MTDNLNSFSYNILIANLYEMYTFFTKEIKNGYKKETIKINYNKILIAMMPIVPHFVMECLEKNKFEDKKTWPNYDEKLLIEDNVNFVIQINGKKRGLIDAKINISEDNLLNEIKKNNNLNKYLDQKNIIKIIFIKNKLMNIII